MCACVQIEFIPVVFLLSYLLKEVIYYVLIILLLSEVGYFQLFSTHALHLETNTCAGL